MWTVQQVLEATDGLLVRGDPATAASGIAIDSRKIRPGEAFVAIRGTRFDGHEFIDDAAHRGASCCIVSRITPPINGSSRLPMVLVDDTTEALGDLARFHRRRIGVPVVAITGSCGKTTTKELTAHLLGDLGPVLKSAGTQNNQIGVPLTLLQLASEHRLAVIELGSNHPGEIAYLASIAKPEIAVITNVGPVHLEFFGSLMGVLQEKLSLLESLPPQGVAVLPGDQLDVCLEAPRYLDPRIRVVTYGANDRCDLQALDVRRSGQGMTLRLRDQASLWATSLVGYHNVENALAAIACAWALGVPLAVARERLASFEPMPLRSEVIRCHDVTILNDCYNANPLSFARALETLGAMEVRRRVAIMGDMLELGSFATSAHQAVGRLAMQLGIDYVAAVGDYAEYVAQGAREVRADAVVVCRTVQELLAQLPLVVQSGDGVLVKGSRKLHLEQVTEFLIEHCRQAATQRSCATVGSHP